MKTYLEPIEVDLPENYQTHSTNYGLLVPALANHAVRALVAAKTVNIPGKSGQVYTLHGVEITIKSVATTVVNTGGLFEFENDAVDWKPFELYPNVSTYVGANTGSAQSTTKIACHKPLPAGSNVSVWYTALNAATDMPIVTLIWSTQPWDGGAQTFIHAGIGVAITQITNQAAHVTLAIPANKGGKLAGFYAQVYGVIETIVTGGGMVVVRNQSCNPSIEPCEFTLGGLTTIGTGGGELLLTRKPFIGDCPGNSSFVFDYQPTDNQSQQLAVMVVWEG
jgi:hypothetical protein